MANNTYTFINLLDKPGVNAALYRNEQPNPEGTNKYIITRFGDGKNAGFIDTPFATRASAVAFRNQMRKQ